MSFSIKTKVAFPVVLLALMMVVLVASSWYALNSASRLNSSLAERFDEIEEVRQIEILFSELVYPHLDYLASPSEEAAAEVHVIFYEIAQKIQKLNKLEVVNQEERALNELISGEIAAIQKLSRLIISPGRNNAASMGHEPNLAHKGTGLNQQSGKGSAPGHLDHQHKMELLNRISEDHISRVKTALADWHDDEARQVDQIAANTRDQLELFSNVVILLAFIMMAVVSFSIWLNNRVLVRPVISLINSTNQFASGDLKAEAIVYAEDELGTLARDINEMASSLDSLYSKLAIMAKTDQLTGLYNRHGYEEIENREVHRSGRYDNPLSVMMLDIDHFKKVNDTYGHGVGDEVIRALAEICIATFRDCDYCFRYGGEEFVILMPDTTAPDAISAAERLRKLVENKQIKAEGKKVEVTVSIGLAQYQKDDAREQFLNNADLALYRAKENGRNRVESNIDISNS